MQNHLRSLILGGLHSHHGAVKETLCPVDSGKEERCDSTPVPPQPHGLLPLAEKPLCGQICGMIHSALSSYFFKIKLRNEQQ